MYTAFNWGGGETLQLVVAKRPCKNTAGGGLDGNQVDSPPPIARWKRGVKTNAGQGSQRRDGSRIRYKEKRTDVKIVRLGWRIMTSYKGDEGQ